MTSIKLRAHVYYVGEDARGANRLKAHLLLTEPTGVGDPKAVFDLPKSILGQLARAGAFAREMEIEIRVTDVQKERAPQQSEFDIPSKGGGP